MSGEGGGGGRGEEVGWLMVDRSMDGWIDGWG